MVPPKITYSSPSSYKTYEREDLYVKLESNEFLSCVDLICEGPIAGLVDSDGNILKYLPNADYSKYYFRQRGLL